MAITQPLYPAARRRGGRAPVLVPLLFLLWSLLPGPARAQSIGPAWGGYLHYTNVIYTADFYTLPGTSLSQANMPFTTGSGNGLATGIAVDLPFSSIFSDASIAPRVHLGLRAGYQKYDAVLRADEARPMARRDGTPVTGTIEHTLQANLSYATFEPIIGFSPFDGFQIQIGGQFALPLSASFVHSRAITWPDPQTLAPGIVAGPDENGDIPDAVSPAVAVLAGVSVAFPLDKKEQLAFIPEVFLSMPITDITGAVDWQASSIRAGVSLLFRPEGRPAPAADTVIIRDTVERFAADAPRERVYFANVEMELRAGRRGEPDAVLIRETYVREKPASLSALRPQIEVVTVSEDGAVRQPVEALVVEEHVVNSLTPLLMYVFFDSASARLPDRYIRLAPAETAGFSPENIADTTLAVYRHLLNIVGRRLRDQPRAVLTLTGCNDGLAEKNTGISQSRAESVRNYLAEVWGIGPDRLRIRTRNLPELPSNPNTDEGAAENRRVELHFGDAALEQPVLVADTTLLMTTGRILLLPASDGDIGVWRVVVSREDQVLQSFHGEIVLPDTLVWNPDPDALARQSGPVTARLAVRRRGAGMEYTAEQQLPVHVRTIREKQADSRGDTETDRYSLLLFEYDGSRLTPAQREIVSTIKQRFHTGDRVTVVGSTDRMGDENYNRRLSLARAQAVAKALGFSDMEVRGAGEDLTTYPNDLPEGRFYSRTVTVIVERNVRSEDK